MTRILFKFIIYPFCERALKNGRVKSKIVGKSSFGGMIFFWLHMIKYDYFPSVFCIVPKKVLLLKCRMWVNHLKNRYHYAKMVENARINFSISAYCTSCSLQWRDWLHYESVRISALKYCRYRTGHLFALRKTAIKALKQGVKFVQT